MKMEYILINSENKRKNNDEENKIEIPNLLDFLNKNFEKVATKNLKSKTKIIGTFEYNNNKYDFTIRKYTKHMLYYFTLNSEISKKKINKIVEVDKKIKVIFKEKFIVICSYDSISEYYCNRIYPKLNNFERRLRLLMFNVYTFLYGEKYYDMISNDVKKAYREDKSVATESEKIEKLKQFLYTLEYGAIDILLFTPRPVKDLEKVRNELLKFVENDNVTINELKKEIKNLELKSDWQKIFEPKITINNIQNIISELRVLRNKVAHCRFFINDDYKQCNKLLNKVLPELEEAIKITMSQGFEEYNNKQLYDVFKGINEMLNLTKENISNLTLNLNSSILSSYKNPFANVDITKINNLFSGIDMEQFKNPFADMDVTKINNSSFNTHIQKNEDNCFKLENYKPKEEDLKK